MKDNFRFKIDFRSEEVKKIEIFRKAQNYSREKSSSYCRLKYDSLGKLQTRPGFPYFELINCNITSCSKGQYLCKDKPYCIDLQNVCDGTIHCHYGDDELNCRMFICLITNFKC